MEIKVDDKKVKITKRDVINSGELNVHICKFTFTSDYDGLVKKAVFVNESNNKYLATIIDNQCSIPATVLNKKGNVLLGVYGYEIDSNNNLVLRYSPKPNNFFIQQGSYDDTEASMIVDTSEGNIENSDVLKDKIAFSKGEKIVGTLEIPTEINVSVKSTEESQTITPAPNYTYNEITVYPIELEEKNVNPTTSPIVVEPDENYDAIKKVTVNAVTSDIDQNIKSSNIKAGVTILGVEGNVEPDKPDQSKVVDPTTSQQIVEADVGYELASVTVNAIQTEQKTVKSTTSSQTITPTSGKFIDEVTVEPIELETKTVIPSTSAQIINPTAGKDGISQINVNAVDNTIDNNIQANNIKKGVPILGVVGTYDPQPNLQSKDVTITENGTQTVNPDAGYDGISDIDITVNVPQPSGTIQITQNGTTDVTNYASADVNVQPNLQNKNVTITENGTQTIVADSDYDGLNSVEVDVDVAGQPVNLWKEIGYSEIPQAVYDDIAYSKNIMDNWDTTKTDMSSALPSDKTTYLVYMPPVDTSNITSMDSAFDGCNGLESIPLLNTARVGSSMLGNGMYQTFRNCKKLKTIPLFNTQSVKSMQSMFDGCTSLTTIPLFNTQSVKSMQSMFEGCTSLESIPQLNTGSVKYMNDMFFDCTSLESIPQLNTARVENMRFMFRGCTILTTIPLLSTTRVSDMQNAFVLCPALSNESLNNILAMCTNATRITSNKTLKFIGLTEEQATTCQSLSNYQAFLDAGWTTGW